MSGLNIYFPEIEIDKALGNVSAKMQQDRQEILEPVGVMLLNLSQIAYEEKSHGRRGSDGEEWAGIQLGSLLARLRRSGHLKAKRVATTKLPDKVPLRKGQRAIHQTTARVKGGNTDKARNARRENIKLFRAMKSVGASFHDKKTGKEVSATRGIRSGTFIAVKEKKDLKAAVPPTGYLIGVDKGLQRASGSPIAEGKNVGGVFVIDTQNLKVTVGYGMSYSKGFDRLRKLIPDELPDNWVEQVADLIGKETGIRFEKILKSEGLS